MGVFADFAARYFESGFSVMPVKGKRPVISGWDKYRERLPTQEELDSWVTEHGECNIGLVCGPASGLAWIDIDATDPAVVAICRKHLPPFLVERVGAKGFAGAVRWNHQHSQIIEVAGQRIGEFLATTQVVLPPSIHPDTREPYRWTGYIDLASTTRDEVLADLPIFSNADLQTFIANVERELGGGETVAAVADQGRNNRLKAACGAAFEKGKTVDVVAKEILAYDLRAHQPPLFSDPTEMTNPADAAGNAFVFATNIFKTFVASKQRKREPIPQMAGIPGAAASPAAQGLIAQFPTMAQGFFKIEPDENGEMKRRPDLVGLGQYLGQEYGLACADAYSYIYDGDRYRMVGETEIDNRIDDLTLHQCVPRQVNEFARAVHYKNFKPESFFRQPEGLINLRNGVLDVKTRKLSSRTKDQFFKYVLPHDFDPKAACPNWIEFLRFVFLDRQELVDVMAEIFGYILLGGDPFLHKAIVLFGEGRNGKSTVLAVLKHLLGGANWSSVPIQAFDKPFSVVMMDSKLANIVSETTNKDIDSEPFKIAVGGEQLIAAQKGKPEYPLTITARIVMACNKLPKLNDATSGGYEKLFILPFEQYILPTARDPHFATRKLYPEMSGILNWALDGLDRVVARGMLPEIAAVEAAVEDYRVESDSVKAWITEYIEVMNEPNRGDDGRMVEYTLRDYYVNYAAYCAAQGRNAVNILSFGKRVAADLKKHHHIFHESSRRGVKIWGNVKITEARVPFEFSLEMHEKRLGKK